MEQSVKKLSTEAPKADAQSDTVQAQKPEIRNVLTYDVLRIIFQHLNAADLVKVSQICRAWRDAANNERTSRRSPECISKYFRIIDPYGYEDTYDEDSYNATLLGKQLRIKPFLGLVCEKIQEENEWVTNGCYCGYLPPRCNTIILGGYDIAINDTKIENKLGSGAAVCAFLPDIPKLNHKIFRIDMNTFEDGSKTTVKSHAKNMLEQLLPAKNEKSKCIIMLSNQDGMHYTQLILEGLQKRYKPGTLSLWGGVCVDLKFCKAAKPVRLCTLPTYWTAINFSSPTLRSWSTVLLSSCRRESSVQENLENLKKNIRLQKHSLGLMFSCCVRIDSKEMEVKVFKRVFPTVPLIGLHGNGEYGINTLSEKRENLIHTYSTIFMILTYS